VRGLELLAQTPANREKRGAGDLIQSPVASDLVNDLVMKLL